MGESQRIAELDENMERKNESMEERKRRKRERENVE